LGRAPGRFDGGPPRPTPRARDGRESLARESAPLRQIRVPPGDGGVLAHDRVARRDVGRGSLRGLAVGSGRGLAPFDRVAHVARLPARALRVGHDRGAVRGPRAGTPAAASARGPGEREMTWLALAAIAALVLIGSPLFAIVGIATTLCLALFTDLA